MGIARNIARLVPNGSGLLPNANIEAVAASKLTGTVSNSQIADLAASKLTGQIPDANAPSGSVIQVVQTVKTDTFTTNSTSYVDITGMSATITPISASNKILVAVNMNVGVQSDTYHVYFRLLKNGSLVSNSVGTSGQPWPVFLHKNGNNYRDMDCASMDILDTAGSTSALTYKIQVACQLQAVRFNYCELSDSWTPGGISTITLTEVAA